MDAARPYAHVIPGSLGKLLATLVQLETPVTLRALARHAEISPQSALDHVNTLADAGVVVAENVGPATLVSLNRQHLVAEPLTALVRTRGRLIDRLREELRGWPGLAGAWLFGSTARGDGGVDSDVDLLLVSDSTSDDPNWTAATSRLRELVGSWTGNVVQLVEYDRTSFAALADDRNPLVSVIRADGIALVPQSRDLLRSAR